VCDSFDIDGKTTAALQRVTSRTRSSRSRLGAALGAALLAALAAALLLPAAAAARRTDSLTQLQAAADKGYREMHRLQTQMSTITAMYIAARDRLNDISTQLVESRLTLAHTQQELDQQRALVSARIQAIYKRGAYTWLDVFFGSGSISDLRSQIDFYNLVLEEDRKVGEDLEGLTATVAQCETAIAAQREAAIGVQDDIAEQRSLLDQKIDERRAALVTLTESIHEILLARGIGSIADDYAAANSGRYTPLTWARALLTRLGMPLTADNIAAIVAWETAEGGHWHNTAHYNPLNTTQPMPGATAMNSVGVKSYVSWQQGFDATVITLHNGYYGGILAALRKGDDALAVARAVGASPWGTGNFSHLL
jgi:peptidoglycan hydrolase CwlO-like protein